jgi:hypothetical protein
MLAILALGWTADPCAQDDGGLPSQPAAGHLRATCLDLVGRPPYANEVERWAGRTHAEVVREILAGEEFWRHWLEEQLYYFLLIDNFRPETEGVTALPEQLVRGQLGVIEALHRICLSSSFDRRNPGPDTFVTVVMEQLLGITVQKSLRELEIGKKVYDGATGKFLGKVGGSQADVVNIAIADERAGSYFLAREYARLVRAEPGPEELEDWSRQLTTNPGSYSSLVARWLESPAYERRLAQRAPLPNRLFVRALYVDLLGRLPGADEGQRLRSALDGMADARPLRSLFARLLIDSGKAKLPERAEVSDPEVWISANLERLLGRPALSEELREFMDAFRDPACRPATVLYAIVSHPVYQTW